jgi:ABC-type polysaccharide/polyol phosphate export permease
MGAAAASPSVWELRHFWLHLARSELRARFRNSRLGVVWCVVPPLAMAVIVSLVMSAVFASPRWDYFVFVLTGLVAWDFITASLVASSSAIVNADAYIRQRALNLAIYPLKVMGANLFILALGSLLCMAAAVVQGNAIWPAILLLPLSLAAMALFALPCATIGALIQVRYRDWGALAAIAMQAIYFLTPVFITRTAFTNAGLGALLEWNPLAALLAVYRAPFEGAAPAARDLALVAASAALLWCLALLLLRRLGPRTVFYL